MKRITPNISMTSQTISNPLVNYFNSLQQVAKLPVSLVLPGHGEVFANLNERIDEISLHHKEKLDKMMRIFHSEPKTVYQIAVSSQWYLPWEKLIPYDKRMAVTETLAHLELLVVRGDLSKSFHESMIWYFLPA